MKKKLALMLTILLSICMLCACGQDPKTVDYNGKSYNDLLTESVSGAVYIASTSESYTIDMLAQEDQSNVAVQALISWKEIESKYGTCTQFSDTENLDFKSFEKVFKIDKAGKTLTTDLTIKFGDKDVIFELIYDTYDMSMTGITLNPVQTLGEKMTSAGQNTLISLSIVFFVLILISLIIKGFVIFPMIEEKKKNKAMNKNVDNVPIIEEVPTIDNTNIQVANDDSELIAVIAAAIAASEGTSTSDFVVRSINRR